MRPALDLDAPYPRLAALPRGLWRPAVISAVGTTEARLAGAAAWREALVLGALPDARSAFGDAAAATPLRAAIAELGLAALARQAPSLAEQLVQSMLWHLDHLIDRPAGDPRSAAIERMGAEFRAEWQRERADWERLLALVPDRGELAQLTRDERRGLLHARAFAEAERLAALMRSRPALAALIRRIGRRQRADLARPAPQPQAGRTRAALRPVATRLPGAPGEVQGLALGDQLERMVPAEAQQLRHPVLRKLWRARRAEARLLHYDSSAEVIDWRPDPDAAAHPAAAPHDAAPRERGPIIVALDTSGSMRGAPEAIAKAVVLEALRVARAEQRGLRLLAFGAAGELVERDLDRGGLPALLELVGQGFDGGTDVAAPIEAALRALDRNQWRDADLLLASDGEFGCTPATLAALDAARADAGLRVTGVLIGDRETIGLMQVADEIFWVRDWRDERPGAASFSPVHSKSLTALFFPGALDARAHRHASPSKGAAPT
ncbi:MAG TPA: VWA domain-containing protein [Burkholderiaceae bacterium]|nr:VWA domain-containing protein [Burkholderiaceae bacterium]